MVLAALLCLLPLISSAVNSMPTGSATMPQGTDKMLAGTEENTMETSSKISGIIAGGVVEGIEDNTTVDEGIKPSAFFLKDVNEYFKLKVPRNRETRQITGGLYHGDTVGLQSFVRHHWLSCSATFCGRHRCPEMRMTGNDWSNCWGEVFRIYRAGGPGAVRVGDLVGLYYPHQAGNWLGCPVPKRCLKSTCPGAPTIEYGFAKQEKWFQCPGEVFEIYARGKVNGTMIDSGDDIVLYYLQERLWVAQGYRFPTLKLPCIGISRPPSEQFFDFCAYETFKVWKNGTESELQTN